MAETIRPVIAYTGSGPTIGADPEIFVVNGAGVIIPAFTFLEDQKKAAAVDDKSTLANGVRGHAADNSKISLHTDYYSLHNDGFQAEFTARQDTCLAYLVDHIQYALRAMYETARKVDPEATLVPDPIMEVPEELLLAAPAKYLQMGCAPSSNVYGIHGEAIADGKELPIRFAGSHVHIGLPTPESRKTPNIERIIMAMDCIAGVMSVALFGGKKERNRREYYGLPGEYRLPKHGVEYRAISAAMLRHPVYYHLLFDAARFAIRMGDNDWMKSWWTTPIESVVNCMRHGTKKHAREIIAREPVFGEFLKARYSAGYLNPEEYRINTDAPEKLLNILLGKQKLRDEGFVKNWKVDQEPKMDNPLRWKAHSGAPNCQAQYVEVAA